MFSNILSPSLKPETSAFSTFQGPAHPSPLHFPSSSSRTSPLPTISPRTGNDPFHVEGLDIMHALSPVDACPVSPSSSSSEHVLQRIQQNLRDKARLVDAPPDSDGLIHFGVGHRRTQNYCGVLHVSSEPCKLVCMKGVPSFLTPADLCGEKLAAFLGNIRHVRVVWGDTSSAYILLLLFNTIPEAIVFHEHFNAKPLSALGPDLVYVYYIQSMSLGNRVCVPNGSITFYEDSAELGDCPICMEKCCDVEGCRHFSPDSSHGHGDAAQTSDSANIRDVRRDSDACSHISESASSEFGHVCSFTGTSCGTFGAIFTTLCNHTFHGKCLSRWGDSCPVCRYNQQDSTSSCFECSFDSADDLWLCITCGNIGCGRYTEGQHAMAHYRKTHHTYSMNLETRQVWDYAGEGFVHRLVCRTDGKVVESPDPNSVSKARDTGDDMDDIMDAKFESKVESICQFYTNLLESQLREQAVYFECKVAESEAEYAMQIEDLQAQIAKASKTIEMAQRESVQLAQDIRKMASKETPAVKKLAGLEEELALQQRISESTNEEIRRCNATLETLRAKETQNPAAAQIAALEERVTKLRLRLTGDETPDSGPTLANSSSSSVS